MAPSSPSMWSRLAPVWEELFPLRQARLDMALALAPRGAACLDAGCATGSLVRALSAHGRRAQGLDLDPDFLAEARRRALEAGLDAAWHQASLLDLASATGGGRFHLITCLGQTLPHLLETREWLDFFSQCREALDPDGCLVIQVVNDASRPVGECRSLPPLGFSGGVLERSRTLLSETLARFETRFLPQDGEPESSQVLHRRMGPEEAGSLMLQAGLIPEAPLADEGGAPFQEASSGWILKARRGPARS